MLAMTPPAITPPAGNDTFRGRVTAKAGGELGLGYCAVVMVTFLWGLGPLFVRGIDASPLTIVFWRNWIVVPVVVSVVWLAKAPLTWRLLKIAVPGGVCFAIAQTLGFASFQDTSLANAVLIGALSPVIIVIVAVPMFGERLTGGQIACMTGTMIAVGVFVLAGGSTDGASIKGDLFAVGSLLGMTGYLLSIKRHRMAGEPAAAYISGVFIVTAIVITPLALIWGSSFTSFTGEEWIYVVMLALLAGCLGHGTMTWAQKHVDLGIASVMVLGTTVVTAAGGWIFFGQELNGVQIAAGAAVLATIGGVLVLQMRGPSRDLVIPEITEAPFAE